MPSNASDSFNNTGEVQKQAGLAAQDVSNGAPYTERKAKRQRLLHADDVKAELQLEPLILGGSISLEVDIMILDYLAWRTIDSCLASRQSTSNQKTAEVNESIVTTDAFLTLFKARHHSDSSLDSELRFRLQLLQLVTLTTTRYTHNAGTPAPGSLARLRRRNQLRAQAWIHEPTRLPSLVFNAPCLESELPLSQDDLTSNRAQMLYVLGLTAENDGSPSIDRPTPPFYGSVHSISLLDLLPLFMHTSASRNALTGSNPEDLWLEMAAEFMLQACLEQYLIWGSYGTDPIDEAFAWGYAPSTDAAGSPIYVEFRDTIYEQEVNAMFEDNQYEAQIEGWSDIKQYYLCKLASVFSDTVELSRPAHSSDVQARLEKLSASVPFQIFERNLLVFYEAMASSIPEPTLVQFERGQLVGMTKAETTQFLEKTCGISSITIKDLIDQK